MSTFKIITPSFFTCGLCMRLADRVLVIFTKYICCKCVTDMYEAAHPEHKRHEASGAKT